MNYRYLEGFLSLMALSTAVVVWWVIALGTYIGFSWRVMTAAVSGANIGGGLLMLVAIVFVPAMAFLAQLLWRVRPDDSIALST